MSKKNTPLPKTVSERKAAKQQVVQPTRVQKALGLNPNREQMSRQEKESELGRLLFIGLGAALVVIVALLAVGIVVDGLIRPSQSVAVVNGQNITVGDFVQRARLERALHVSLIDAAVDNAMDEFGIDYDTALQSVLSAEPYATYYNELISPEVMGLRVVDDMVNQRLVEGYAAGLETPIAISDEEVEAKINELIGYDPEAVSLIGAEPTATTEPTVTPTPFVSPTPTVEPTSTPEPTATFTPEGGATEQPTTTPAPTATVQPTRSADEVRTTFESRRQNIVANTARLANVGEGTVRDYFRYLALEDAVAATLSDSTEETTLYADARHILVETPEEANDLIAALNAGESFADLARAVSTDTGSGANGGELGWNPVSNYVTEFAEAIRDAEIGAIVGPVETDFGYHIIQVRAKEQREATEDEIERARQIDFDTWLEDLRVENEANFETTSAWVENVPSSPTFIYRPR